MLESLSIKNFALIEEVSLYFCDQLNILSGETGAGKSILVDAVGLLLGGRAQGEFIRTGAEKAFIEGVFRLSERQQQACQLLEELGIEPEEDLVVMSRELNVNGRNSCRINGRTLPLSQYRLVGQAIVDIHGQHDHQALLQAENHLEILDRFGGGELSNSLADLETKFASWQNIRRELKEINRREKERLQRIDFLQYQIKEIEEADLKRGELADLTTEANILANGEKIASGLSLAYNCLFRGEGGSSAYDQLGSTVAALQEISKYDPEIANILEQIEPLLYQLEDISTAIRKYKEGIEYSPERLEEVERRRQLLKDLCKKYGPEEEDVLNFLSQAKEELAGWGKSEELAVELEEQAQKVEQEYYSLAQEVSAQRREIAANLESRVVEELIDLAMPDVQFAVSFRDGDGTAKGIDQVEFLISPNPGEPLLPVAKIASGGELSRIILALKTISAHFDGIGTLIFDEIDTGIGGKAAQKLAEKLGTISQHQQVICVTHSPILAALADRHLFLDKETVGGRTRTIVKDLTEEERVQELVRMLGGDKATEELVKHARQIMKK
ncbi:MAG: DNA repair protein RecN [Peptococcia bacterium]